MLPFLIPQPHHQPFRDRILSPHSILHATAPSAPVLVYLPSGPVVPGHREDEDQFVAALALFSKSTIARINYRFTSEHRWPTPLYDVLSGYDWVLDNLLEEQSRPAKLGVCGELVGGSLATTLALTECRTGENRIVSAAVNNPIADWVFPDDLPIVEPARVPEPRAPDETQFPADHDMMTWWEQQDQKEDAEEAINKKKPKKRAPKKTSWTSNSDNDRIPTLTLSGERDVLFSSPYQLLDRFASPIHFFRSPHGQLLYPHDEGYSTSASSSAATPDPVDAEAQMSIRHYESFDAESPEPVPILSRCRAYARIYPDSATSISLPQWHITSGLQSPLLDQSSELAKMLKRSIARHALRTRTARVMWQDPVEKAKYESWAALRVRYNTVEGVGLWTLPDDGPWKVQADDVGQWLHHSLKSELL